MPAAHSKLSTTRTLVFANLPSNSKRLPFSRHAFNWVSLVMDSPYSASPPENEDLFHPPTNLSQEISHHPAEINQKWTPETAKPQSDFQVIHRKHSYHRLTNSSRILPRKPTGDGGVCIRDHPACRNLSCPLPSPPCSTLGPGVSQPFCRAVSFIFPPP